MTTSPAGPSEFQTDYTGSEYVFGVPEFGDLLGNPDLANNKEHTKYLVGVGVAEEVLSSSFESAGSLTPEWAKKTRETAVALLMLRQEFTGDSGDVTEGLSDDDITGGCQEFDEIIDALPEDLNQAFEGHRNRVTLLLAEGRRPFDAKGLLENLAPAEILMRASEAAKDHTVIYSYMSPGSVRVGESQVTTLGGYSLFGSGLGSESEAAAYELLNHEQPEEKDRPSEYVQFLTAKEFSGTDYQPEPVKNPVTGAMEQPVVMRYKFSYNAQDAAAARDYLLPRYDDPTGRGQQFIEVAVPLPESIARQLQLLVAVQPKAIRALVDSLVVDEGGLSKTYWEGEGVVGAARRPPYEALDRYEARQATEYFKTKKQWTVGAFLGRA